MIEGGGKMSGKRERVTCVRSSTVEHRGTLSNRAGDIPWWFVFGFGFGRELEGEVVELTISCDEVATMVRVVCGWYIKERRKREA